MTPGTSIAVAQDGSEQTTTFAARTLQVWLMADGADISIGWATGVRNYKIPVGTGILIQSPDLPSRILYSSGTSGSNLRILSMLRSLA